MSERGAKVKGVCLEVTSTSPIDDFQYKHIDFFQLQNVLQEARPFFWSNRSLNDASSYSTVSIPE
jgi:hypothetical protein